MIENKIDILDALDNMNSIHERISGKKLAFFLDYDGTLSPIVDKPELAVLSDEMRNCLQKLSQKHFVAIISGRQLENVRECVGIDSLYYAGNHGLEVAGPDNYETRKELDTEYLALLESVCKQLESDLKPIKNSLIENKKFSLSVHYRLVDEKEVPKIEEAVDRAIAQHTILKKRHGKKVFEIYPDIAWDKGKAVLYLMEQQNLLSKEFVPFYLGDDMTDEDAFREIKHRGIAVLVSTQFRQSAANFILSDTNEVIKFLNIFTV